MASGLFALLDDVATITKMAAASIDDIGAAAVKSGAKTAGVIIDDAAVTPRYLVGFSPDRELPVIVRIARGSIRNKLLLILPIALLLSALLPWLLTPLLMIGGAYLCFEGAEKSIHSFFTHDRSLPEKAADLDSAEHETMVVKNAIRTDMILSAEIMVIALASVAGLGLLKQALVLALVAVGVTIGVYGIVALIVKIDDIGVALARCESRVIAMLGRSLVRFMPVLLCFLAVVGTGAMLWVGGGIILHGLEEWGYGSVLHSLRDGAGGVGSVVGSVLPWGSRTAQWLVEALGAGLFGAMTGSIIMLIKTRWLKLQSRLRLKYRQIQ